jgi:hypothetical protein
MLILDDTHTGLKHVVKKREREREREEETSEQ